jgi:hypothetical protein
MLHGGRRINVVPDRAVMQLEKGGQCRPRSGDGWPDFF